MPFKKEHTINSKRKQSREWIDKRISKLKEFYLKFPKPRGKDNPSWKGGDPICEVCGKQLKNYYARFCFSHAKSGDKHPNWKGGISREPYSVDWTETLRRAIRERDNYICQRCNQYGDNVHHIDYNKKNCDPTNLITLCRGCNSRVNFDTERYKEYFKNLLIKRKVTSR